MSLRLRPVCRRPARSGPSFLANSRSTWKNQSSTSPVYGRLAGSVSASISASAVNRDAASASDRIPVSASMTACASLIARNGPAKWALAPSNNGARTVSL